MPGENPQPFTFETRIGGIPAALVPGGITLNDDPSDAMPRSITFQVGLSETPLEVVEMLPSGWVVEDIVCTGPADGARVDVAAGTVLVERDPGEEVRCTFVNVRKD